MRIFKIWRQNRPGWTQESRSIAFVLGCDEPDKESRGSWGCRSHTYLNSLNVPLVVVKMMITAEEPRPRSATVEGQPGEVGGLPYLIWEEYRKSSNYSVKKNYSRHDRRIMCDHIPQCGLHGCRYVNSDAVVCYEYIYQSS